MKLTQPQIEDLFVFTRKHYVEWIDLQTELVDHLANDIETIWKEQPNLSYREARDKSFKKFGVFGFMDVVEARGKSLNKKYLKLIWGVFKQYFKLPQLLFTLFLFITIYSSFYFINSYTWVYALLGFAVYGVLLYRTIQLNKIKKQRFKKTNKKWLLEEYVLNVGNGGSLGCLWLQIPLNIDVHNLPQTYSIVMAFFLICYLILIYIVVFVLPSKIEEILINEYPEYKLV